MAANTTIKHHCEATDSQIDVIAKKFALWGFDFRLPGYLGSVEDGLKLDLYNYSRTERGLVEFMMELSCRIRDDEELPKLEADAAAKKDIINRLGIINEKCQSGKRSKGAEGVEVVDADYQLL